MGSLRRVLAAVATTLLLSMAVGCSSSGDESASGGGGGSGDAPHGIAVDDSTTSGADASGDRFRPLASAELPPVGPSVIKTADVAVRVGRLQEAIRALVAVARNNGGFVLSTSVRDEPGDGGTVVMRVPAERFETALGDAEATGDVLREQVSGEDVGQEFVDLEARSRNFEAQESVLLDLMSRSTSVADTLRVQRELQDVQLEIERLRGRLRYLRDQTDLSTITVDLTERVPVVAAPSTIARAWQRAVDTFAAIVSGIVVGLGVVLPIALLALLVLVIGRPLGRRLASWVGAARP